MTPKEQAAMQQALEELTFWQMEFNDAPRTAKAIAALREALANTRSSIRSTSEYSEQAEQEPVAWQFFEDGKWWIGREYNHHRQLTEEAGYPIRELYAAPQPVQQVDLTDDEIQEIRAQWLGKGIGFARAVITAYKEKNK